MFILNWLTIAFNAVVYFLLGLVVMFTGGGVWRCVSQAARHEDIITRAGLPSYEAGLPGAKMHFLPTGSSDAILLESDGHFALVDCAEDSDNPKNDPGLAGVGYEDYVVDYVKRVAGDADGKAVLDFVLGTHAHSDHIGGFDTLLLDPDITVKKAFLQLYTDEDMNETERGWDNAEVYRQMMDACAAREVPVVQDIPAEPFQLGALTVTILNGGYDPAWLKTGNENDSSLGLLVQAGKRRAFLAGDILMGDDLALCGRIGKVDLLKVGHHGHPDGTSVPFVAALRPEIAVFTSGDEKPDASTKLALFANSALYTTKDFGGLVAVFGDKVTLYAIGDTPKSSP